MFFKTIIIKTNILTHITAMNIFLHYQFYMSKYTFK